MLSSASSSSTLSAGQRGHSTRYKCKGVILLLIQRLDKAPFDLKKKCKTTSPIECYFCRQLRKVSFAFLQHCVNSSLVTITEKPPHSQVRQVWTRATAPLFSSRESLRSLYARVQECSRTRKTKLPGKDQSIFFLSISDMMNHLFLLVLDDRKQL